VITTTNSILQLLQSFNVAQDFSIDKNKGDNQDYDKHDIRVKKQPLRRLVILDKPTHEPNNRGQDEGKDYFQVANKFLDFINFRQRFLISSLTSR
jgi:hypothetical protein